MKGLKSLILKENPFAFYVHCFALQLQLTIVTIAKIHIQLPSLFNLIAILVNVIGDSCKCHDMFREKRMTEAGEAFGNGEIITGCGLNQEIGLKRPGDTCWGCNYGTLMNLILNFTTILDVLEFIVEDGIVVERKAKGNCLLDIM